MLGTSWRKASRSNSFSNCVQVRLHDGMVQVRDSKNPRPVLHFSPEAFGAFLARCRDTRACPRPR